MQHHWTLEEVKLNNSWLTVGTYDGIHLGHQEIIRCVTEGAKKDSVPSVVVTFFPPPAVVLSKRQDPYYLTSPEERVEILGKLGVDIVITHPFNLQISQISALDFVSRLKKHLGMTHLCIGHDFALGKNREGDAKKLAEIGKDAGFALHAISAMQINHDIVSSSFIRKLLADGEVDRIERYLGRKYRISGKVIPGDHRGKQLGFPTANLDIWAERALPREGVYACKVEVDGKIWDAVTNIGVRPTFEIEPVAPRVETHLLDFNENLYGRDLRLEFIARLRAERKFANIEELVKQIQTDINTAKRIFQNN